MTQNVSPRWLVAILALAVLVLLAGGVWFYRSQEQQLRQHAEEQLEAIADLKVNQIASWRAERLADAAVIAADPFFIEGVAQWLADPQSEQVEYILARFRSVKEQYGYYDVLLVDATGQVRLSLSGRLDPLDEETVQVVTALRDRQPTLTDLHPGSGDLPIHMGVIAPLFAANAQADEPVGAVILQSDATQFLYPLIQSWPTLSDSAETLLVRREGDAVLFLNALRHQAGAALALRIPLSETGVPAVMAAHGTEGVVQGKDYRGVEVLAALRAIPDSPWFMVAKVDAAEVFADWHTRSALIAALVLGLVAMTGTAAGLVWQRSRRDHYQKLFEAERARQVSEARYHATLLSIGDGVITTDAEGRVELLNPVAAALTGWTEDEARGRPLEEIFQIVSEETREPAENPARRVMREGTVVGLANHTLLIARDGQETPIADSGAPVRDAAGDLSGVVLVFRDQTEERAAQKALAEREAYIRTILDNLPIGVAVNAVDPTVEFSYMNDNFVRYYRTTREALADPDAFWEAVYEDPEFREEIRKRVLDDTASGDPARMRWDDVPITREGEETIFISAMNVPIHGTQLMLSAVWDTTARKRAEEALVAERNLLRTLIDNLPDLIYAKDIEGRFILKNLADVRQMGAASPEETIGRTDFDYYPLDIAERFHADDQAVIQSGQPLINREESGVGADGTRGWFLTSKVPLRDRRGEIVGLVGIGRDITERKQAEEARRESEARYRRLAENAQDLIYRYRLSPDPAFEYVNPAATIITGYTPEDYYADPQLGFKLVHPDDRALLQQQVSEGPSSQPIVLRWVRKDGTVIWTEQRNVPVYDEHGNLIALEGIARDITERKRAEEALREHNRRLSALNRAGMALAEAVKLPHIYLTAYEHVSQLVDCDGFGVALYDPATRTLQTAFRVSEGEPLEGGDAPPLALSEDAPPTARARAILAQQAEIVADAPGDDRAVHSALYVPMIVQGQTIGLLEVESRRQDAYDKADVALLGPVANQVGLAIENARLIADLEAERNALEARVAERTAQLNHAKERIEAILNSSNDLIVLCRKDGTISQVNPAFCQTFGCKPDEPLLQPLSRLAVDHHAPILERAFEVAVETRQPQRLEITVQCKHHPEFDADLVLSPIVQDDGQLLGVVCSLRDITERKQMEARLRQMLKHEMELSELRSRYLSMAAHDLRNPLAVVQSMTSLMHKRGERMTAEQKQVRYDRIQASIKTMIDMLDDILTVGKIESGRLRFTPAPMDLVAFCCQIAAEVEQGADTVGQIAFSSEGACGAVTLDARLLRHILENLLSNAIKYSPAERAVTFTVRCEPEQIVLRVQDQGIGIPEADQARLFETFYRASNARHVPGTGLGLAIVKQSVEMHGGKITFESQEGAGTTFTVTLPQAPPETTEAL